MIALRGKLRFVRNPKKTSKDDPKQSQPSPITKDTPFSPINTVEGQWIWTGHWAFGSLPSEKEIQDAIDATNRKPGPGRPKAPLGVRPFVYKFEKVVDAKDVIVPSSVNISASHSLDGNDTDKDGADQPSNNADSEEKTKGDNENKSEHTKDADGDVKMSNETESKTEEKKELNENKDLKSDSGGDIAEEKTNTDDKDVDKSSVDEVNGNSFADIEDGIFTDAAKSIYPEKCPIGGTWKGYFENVSKRKDRMTSRVAETFHLFFNATPPPRSRINFDERDDEDINDDDTGILPKGFLHVRGSGENQFGTFEIIGGYNPETLMLSIQRMYVATTEEKPERSKEKPKTPTSTPLKKSYFTRKRPVKVKKPFEVTEDESAQGSARKRARTMSEYKPSSEDISKAESVETTPALLRVETQTEKTIATNLVPKVPTPSVSATKTPQTTKRPSPNKSSRKPKISQQSSSKSSRPSGPAPKPVNSFMNVRIPVVGNPQEARWRSAHYLYFLRHSDEAAVNNMSPPNTTGQSSNSPGTKTASAPIKTSYVVYEGEMNAGNNIREGRGVSLYNNNMIYEGEWRKNKEHGHGSLYNADRSQTIYIGDWERGKMHGQGTYYYHVMDSDGKIFECGRYTGEFRENARNGLGKYTMADGSSFEGEWRDNVPNGKGVFQWADGSIYNGNWKDGKRHGMGRLIVSDGFEYDGMWVNNSMEGKGRAIYPSGQQYDGSWLNGKRDGRGTIIFGNGAVYKGRFKEDCLEGQGTLKLDRNVSVPSKQAVENETEKPETNATESKDDWMIPIEFQSDIGHIHQRAGFTTGGE